MELTTMYESLGVSRAVYEYGETILAALKPRFEAIDQTAEYNQTKVLAAMQKNKLSAGCFAATTGYGYDDMGREVLEKVVTDYAILPAKPNMEEFKRAMLILENHSIIQRIEGKYNQPDCRFAILPTILTAVSAERLHEVAAVLRKEEENGEEAEEDTAG